MVSGREEAKVTARLRRPFLNRRPVRPAAVHVHVKRSSEPVVAVGGKVDQAVVPLGPQALADEIGATRPRLRFGAR